MARLNDLPPAAESLESLKRRFIRQNREIARANSIQSARIRTLESEVSRLVTENVTLRDEISWLNRELEKRQGSERFDNQVFAVKEKLEAKLVELSALVTDLSSLPQKRIHTNSANQASGSPSLSLSPAIVRPGQNPLVEDEDRLPVILEDKNYPRLTPEIEEIPESPIPEQREENVVDSSRSPPILSFVANTISQFPTHISPTITEFSSRNSPLSLDKSPSPGIRRRRRDSSFLEDIIPDAEPVAPQDDSIHKPQVSRAGSKRKFAVREEEESDSGHPNDKDDFQYARLNMSSENVPSTTYDPENQPGKGHHKVVPQQVKDKKSSRRALGPKSTNTNLRSPIKKSSEKLKAAVEEKRSTRAKGRPRKVKPEEVNDLDQQPYSVLESQTLPQVTPNAPSTQSILQQAPEETAPDTFAPPAFSPLPINYPPSSKKTVIPLDPDSTDAESSANSRTRQSRRSRGPVSYAEPNLRDKMRRPTEELVDAVGGNRNRRISKAQLEHAQGSSKDESMCNQATQQVQYKPLNTLELSSQQTGEQICSTLSLTEANHTVQSPSSIAISTLVAGTKKRCQNKQGDSRRNSSNPLFGPSPIPLQTLSPGHEEDWDLAETPPEGGHNEYALNPATRTKISNSSVDVDTSRTQRVHVTRRRSMMV